METNEYCYLIRPKRGSDFISTMTPEEERIMGEHFQYLQALLAEGTLILAGPCLDGAFGVCVLRADSPEAAERLMNNDPAVSQGAMSAELHPFRAALMEGH